MLRGPSRARWAQARDYCAANGMELPHPRNQDENNAYSAAGPTWLDVNVNTKLNDGEFNNFRRRQRAWMDPTGRWISRIAGRSLDYFCVEPGKDEH